MGTTKGNQEGEKKVAKYLQRAKSSPDTGLKGPWNLQNCQFLSCVDILVPLYVIFLKKNFHVQKMWNSLTTLIQSLHRGQ